MVPRTVLLSRWRTGGQSSLDLVREFVQELPHASAADAWQRSLLLVSKDAVNPAGEPRLRLSAHEEPPKGDHPFFWAGYLLADTGTLPQELADERRKALAEQPPVAEKPAKGQPQGAANGQQNKQGAATAPGNQPPGGLMPFPSVGGAGVGGAAAPQRPGAPRQFGAPQQPGGQQQPGNPQQPADGAFIRARPNAGAGGFGAPNTPMNEAGGANAGLGQAGGPIQGGFDGPAKADSPTGKPARKTKAPKTTRTPKEKNTDEFAPMNPGYDESGDDGTGKPAIKHTRKPATTKSKKSSDTKAGDANASEKSSADKKTTDKKASDKKSAKSKASADDPPATPPASANP